MTTTLVRRRRGMSLVELLITMVLVAIIGAAAGRLLTSQTRYFARMSAKREARSVTRNAMNLLQTELSMVDPAGGVVAASADSIKVNMPYAWGLFCSSNTMMMLPVDSAMYAMATFAGYAIKDTTATGAYTYTASGTAPTAGTASNCTGMAYPITAPTNGVYLSVSGSSGTAGSPMLLYQVVTYKFASSGLFPGKRGLFRRVGSGTADEILGPFESTARFKFYELTNTTSQTTVPSPLTNMRGIELKLDAASPTRASNRATNETISLTTAIFFRNRTT
jgi:prepilin-type N-terminal cleavage/methylation domain-containing protein